MLGAGVDMALALALLQVLAGALADILGAHAGPGNVADFLGGEDLELLAVHHQGVGGVGDLAGELAVHAVILQHVGHILGVHEGVVQADDLDVVALQGGAEHDAADAAKTIDADFRFHNTGTPFEFWVQIVPECHINDCVNDLFGCFPEVIVSQREVFGNHHFKQQFERAVVNF